MRFSRVNAVVGVLGPWSCCTRCLRRASLSSSRIAAVAESSDVIWACTSTPSRRPAVACWMMDGERGLGRDASSAVDITEPTLCPPVAEAEVVKEERDDFTKYVQVCQVLVLVTLSVGQSRHRSMTAERVCRSCHLSASLLVGIESFDFRLCVYVNVWTNVCCWIFPLESSVLG